MCCDNHHPNNIQKIENNEDPISLSDASHLIGYTKATIYSLIHKKIIPYYKTAGRKKLFFYKSELISWMHSKKEDNGG